MVMKYESITTVLFPWCPKTSDGALMDNADLNAILNCNGLATAAIMDSTATDGSANEIANTECFNTSQWEDFVNSVLNGS